ncbi:MAG: hypothetical protein L6R41_000500 [Letrouitia leprolyta]|nr:MAG: hypothetical protein L6R41_000500 [Letrouitia leprolyta]
MAGDYGDRMRAAMQRRGFQQFDPINVLFKCTDSFGSIEMVNKCSGQCLDGGLGRDDYCAHAENLFSHKQRQQTISTPSSAKMSRVKQQKQGVRVEDAIAALRILEEALAEKMAGIEVHENAADALVIVATALDL